MNRLELAKTMGVGPRGMLLAELDALRVPYEFDFIHGQNVGWKVETGRFPGSRWELKVEFLKDTRCSSKPEYKYLFGISEMPVHSMTDFISVLRLFAKGPTRLTEVPK